MRRATNTAAHVRYSRPEKREANLDRRRSRRKSLKEHCRSWIGVQSRERNTKTNKIARLVNRKRPLSGHERQREHRGKSYTNDVVIKAIENQDKASEPFVRRTRRSSGRREEGS
jgi:hypothetical protein